MDPAEYNKLSRRERRQCLEGMTSAQIDALVRAAYHLKLQEAGKLKHRPKTSAGVYYLATIIIVLTAISWATSF